MIRLLSSQLEGGLDIQASKSVLHRMLICAALAEGTSRVGNMFLSEDIGATLRALRDMGLCAYEMKGDVCVVRGGLHAEGRRVIDCGESGSTLRFLLPLAFDGRGRLFTGRGRLPERPMRPYEQLLAPRGYRGTSKGIEVKGTLQPGDYPLPGDVSSQFVSGLLFALPLLEGGSSVTLTTPLESGPYVEVTRRTQKSFGVDSRDSGNGYRVPGKQMYRPADLRAEGDFSHAAFFAAAAAMAGKVTLRGLDRDSIQGDKEIFHILSLMGANVEWAGDSVTVEQASLRPVELDVSQIPDLVPVLAVLACAARGRTRIYNAARLRFKESDRLHAMAAGLERLGADITEYGDSLVIYGRGRLAGGGVRTHGDHRIAMALGVASCISDGAVTLDEPGVVNKSAPRFFEEFAELGGRVE